MKSSPRSFCLTEPFAYGDRFMGAPPLSRSNPKSHELVFSTVDRMAKASQFLGRSIELAGNVAGYALWRQARGFRPRRFLHRERLGQRQCFHG